MPGFSAQQPHSVAQVQLNNVGFSRSSTTEITSAAPAEPSAPSIYDFMAYPAIFHNQQAASAAPSAVHSSAVDPMSHYGEPAAPHAQLMSHHSRAQSPKLYQDNSRISIASATGGSKQQQSLDHWLVPDTSSSQYWALWTSIFTLAACFVFAFMAGGFGTYQQSVTYMQYHNGTTSTSPLTTAWGPEAIRGWLKFWSSSPVYSFDVGYLMAWGARYQPSIAAGDWWRLFSSICIHGSFSHLFSNMLALVMLAVPLEHTYGPLRVFAIFLSAGFGGTFLSMVFEDPCFVYVGASGAVFGFLGLYLADILLNFESMYRPLLRLALMLTSLGLTLGIEFATARVSPLLRVSHMSHVGGLVAGLFTSFMFLPNLKDKRWKAARKLAGRIGTLGHSIYDRISHGGGAGSAAAGGRSSSGGLHWSLLERMQSCWRRHAWLYRSVWVLSALVMLFMFCGLPVWIWLFRMPTLQCAALVAA
ncbi:hypothetical protein OEZ86_000641 [Tetradesmus obliquus]|nr:hypothetical protein OEZ86_000641 [Tetradesmus obliquus]